MTRETRRSLSMVFSYVTERANAPGGNMAGENVTIDPNARCSCGSGKKFKNCHGAVAESKASAKKKPTGYIVAVVIVLAVAAFALYKYETKPSGQVWSEEHGHYHD